MSDPKEASTNTPPRDRIALVEVESTYRGTDPANGGTLLNECGSGAVKLVERFELRVTKDLTSGRLVRGEEIHYYDLMRVGTEETMLEFLADLENNMGASPFGGAPT